ncbi:MAG: alcohol dehydrogenase catalytic domain-containing protein [Anaerolineae bacterium]|nr:alcohol dehydrogenase catalytic domain-containing protein [Anaerolineae bacterium]
MRALRYDEHLHLSHDEPAPTLDADEALIKVRLGGICHTDLELTRGYMNFRGVLGHEFVGEIVQGNEQWMKGTRVVGEINIACQRCEYCLMGIPSQCLHRRTLGLFDYAGTFADQMKLPFANLYAVPDSVPDNWAVFAEPLAAALQVIDQVQIKPTMRVLLIGAGKLGLLIAQVLKHTGCDLSVIVRRDKPKRLLEKWGIPTIDSRSESLDSLRQSAHVVVEATGSEEGFALALNSVRARGTIVLKSTYADLPRANLTKVVVDEITVVGSRCGPFEPALRLMERRQVDVESMIDGCYSLDHAEEAFALAAQSGVLKVLLQP